MIVTGGIEVVSDRVPHNFVGLLNISDGRSGRKGVGCGGSRVKMLHSDPPLLTKPPRNQSTPKRVPRFYSTNPGRRKRWDGTALQSWMNPSYLVAATSEHFCR
jgi:hypothetical protein